MPSYFRYSGADPDGSEWVSEIDLSKPLNDSELLPSMIYCMSTPFSDNVLSEFEIALLKIEFTLKMTWKIIKDSVNNSLNRMFGFNISNTTQGVESKETIIDEQTAFEFQEIVNIDGYCFIAKVYIVFDVPSQQYRVFMVLWNICKLDKIEYNYYSDYLRLIDGLHLDENRRQIG